MIARPPWIIQTVGKVNGHIEILVRTAVSKEIHVYCIFSMINIICINIVISLTFLAPLCHLAAELFKCRLVRRRRRRRRRRRQL